MATNQGAREDDVDPLIEVIEVVETRRSVTRMRSPRRAALEIEDAHERPTVVPVEPVDVEALEARVLFESRAVMERRYAIATQQDLQATRKMDAIDLELPIHVSVDPRAPGDAVERRSRRVRMFALTLMLAFVIAVAAIVFR